jgi:hypothetical protein
MLDFLIGYSKSTVGLVPATVPFALSLPAIEFFKEQRVEAIEEIIEKYVCLQAEGALTFMPFCVSERNGTLYGEKILEPCLV